MDDALHVHLPRFILGLSFIDQRRFDVVQRHHDATGSGFDLGLFDPMKE